MQVRLPRTVRLLIVARAVNRLGAFAFSFLTVLIMDRFGVSVAAAGLVSAAFGLATIPSRLIGGYLADRLGRRRTIVLGLLGCAVAHFGIAASGSLAAVFVFAVLLGLAFELYEPASQAMIADAVGPAERARAYSLFNAAMAAAGMGAGLIAAGVGRWDLRWLFVIDALTCLVCAIIVRSVLPADRPPVTRARTAGPSAWRDLSLIAMLACGTLIAFVYMGIIIMLPLALAARGLEAADAGILFTVSAITIIGAQPLLRMRPLAGLSSPAAIAVGAVLMAAGLTWYGFADTMPALVVATVVWSAGDLVMVGHALAIVADLAPPEARGRYLAVYGLSWGVASVAVPVAGTQLLDRLGPPALWAVMAALCVVIAVAQLGIKRLLSPARHQESRCDPGAPESSVRRISPGARRGASRPR